MRIALPEAMDTLHHRNFRLVFGAYAISVFGDFVVPVALAFAVLDLTGSATDLGLVLGARVLPIVLFVLVGGVWADRLPRHHVIVASNIVRAAGQGLLGVLLLTGVAEIWQVAALQVVHGAATAFSRPAGTGLVADVVPGERLQQANALFFLSLSIGGIAGPAVAGILVATVGPGWALLIDAGTFAVAGAMLLAVRAPAPVAAARRSFFRELAEGFDEVRRRQWLWVGITDFAVFQLVSLSALLVLGPVVAKESLGGVGAWALIATAFGVGLALGNVLAFRFEPERPLRTAFALLLLTTPSLVLLAVAAPAFAIAAAEIVGGIAVGYGSALWETTLQQQIPRDALARVSAYDWMGSTALRPIGFAVIGPVAAAIGTETTLIAAAALSAAATLTVLSVPSVRRVRSGLAHAPERDVAPVTASG